MSTTMHPERVRLRDPARARWSWYRWRSPPERSCSNRGRGSWGFAGQVSKHCPLGKRLVAARLPRPQLQVLGPPLRLGGTHVVLRRHGHAATRCEEEAAHVKHGSRRVMTSDQATCTAGVEAWAHQTPSGTCSCEHPHMPPQRSQRCLYKAHNFGP